MLWKTFGFAVVVAGLTVGCAHSPRPLEMPEWWNDQTLARIKGQGRFRPSLHVAPFSISRSVPVRDLKLDEMLTTALRETGRVEISRQDDVQKTMSYQDVAQSGVLSDSEKVAQVGEMVGAEAQIVGTLSSATQQTFDKFSYDLIRTEVRVDARVVDTTTNQTVTTATALGASETKRITDSRGNLISGAVDSENEYAKAASEAVRTLAKEIAAQYPLIGTVLSVSGGKPSVDIGSDRGLKEGTTLIVFRPGEQLVHPTTGQPAGWDKTVLAIGKAANVVRGTSRVMLDAPAPSIKPGDLVLVDAGSKP